MKKEEEIREYIKKKGLNLWENVVKQEGQVLDPWQQKTLDYKGNILLRNGRQTGKTEVISKKGSKLPLEYPGTETLIIAASQRQSTHIFEKMLLIWGRIDELLLEKAKKEHKKEWEESQSRRDKSNRFNLKYGLFTEKPTKTKAILKNGSRIQCLPAGKTGVYLRCFTIDFLIGDEAAYIPNAVYVAVKPMLAVSRKLRGLGWEIYLSTPFGKGGYFYDCDMDEDFMHIHISSEECPRIPRDFLAKEKRRLSKLEYAQEYLGEYVDEFNQLFDTTLIKNRMTFLEWDNVIHLDRNYYLGVDVARYGGDENAFVIIEMQRAGAKDKLKIIYVSSTERKGLTDTKIRIQMLNDRFNFRKIFIDSAGVGGGLYDMLVDGPLKRKVIGLENAKRTLDQEGKKGKIFKEDLYSNAIVLMESEPPLIEIISSLKLLKSLKSVTYEYTADRNLRISGNYTHFAEAFVRACWCVKTKGLNIFVR